ncbi:MAG: hypothetical protein JNJ83_08870 [Verrucomicrobiaceae bacterium]|nr:hypothetical protein [Verrucomicrobiaceae bacterium]
MKTIPLFLLAVVFSLSATPHAEAQTFMDKVRRAFDSTKQTVGEAARGAGSASKAWLEKAKENLRLSRPEYTSRANTRIINAAAGIQKVRTGPSGVVDRKYYKTRLAALDQHLEYARAEFAFLQSSPTEQIFRDRQRDFDFTLWSLEEAVAFAETEAGL